MFSIKKALSKKTLRNLNLLNFNVNKFIDFFKRIKASHRFQLSIVFLLKFLNFIWILFIKCIQFIKHMSEKFSQSNLKSLKPRFLFKENF